MNLLKFFIIASIVLWLGIYASEIPYELQSGTSPVLIESGETADIQKYNDYLIYVAYLVILMVIASSISQIQKYRQR